MGVVVVTPTVLYGCEAWAMSAKTRKMIHLLDMMFLQTIAGVKYVHVV